MNLMVERRGHKQHSILKLNKLSISKLTYTIALLKQGF